MARQLPFPCCTTVRCVEDLAVVITSKAGPANNRPMLPIDEVYILEAAGGDVS